MFKYILIVGVVLSLLVLLAAALLSPAHFNSQDESWCSMMEHKPNKQWQGDDFERFAKECL